MEWFPEMFRKAETDYLSSVLTNSTYSRLPFMITKLLKNTPAGASSISAVEAAVEKLFPQLNNETPETRLTYGPSPQYGSPEPAERRAWGKILVYL